MNTGYANSSLTLFEQLFAKKISETQTPGSGYSIGGCGVPVGAERCCGGSGLGVLLGEIVHKGGGHQSLPEGSLHFEHVAHVQGHPVRPLLLLQLEILGVSAGGDSQGFC